ncbi:bacteriohemerythrin [Brucepastera parasyntrophica]|uniref:bacteriohemerythrin n=1 Tax=Brucepastera parasyntrophica TaxID=2880008 RepID=UPI0021097BD0|nr:bacteriohemerythrin [Brucepastera parasyntrophica]ULQ59627.1 bacteriohemerythrin [Brucepastera parasyntrophica]
MEEKTIIEWEDRYTVYIPMVDDQHKHLVSMTNELYEGCLLGGEAAHAYFQKAIHEAVQYVQKHFATEEKILKTVNYPEYSIHKKEHEDFILEVLQQVKNFQEGKKFVPNNFVRFLREWVLTHIAVSDKKYADYLLKLKKEGKI